MAIIRRATRQVGATALPGARLTAAETPLSTGAGLDEARAQKDNTIAGTFAQGARIATSLVQKETDDANEVALLKADNALAAWKTKTLYDPDNGALTKKGEDAMPLPELVAHDFNKTADTIAQGLGNSAQKAAFSRMRAQSFQQVDLEVRRHVFGEMQEFRATELKSAIDNGVDAAIRSANDPKLLGLSLQKVEQQMRTNLPKLGVGPAQLEDQVRTVKSNVHVGVINQLLAQGKDRDASDYFAEAKGQIAGDKLDEVTKAIAEGSTRGESQRVADPIIAAGGTLKEQLAKAKDLEPKLRDAVEERIEHASAQKATADRAQEESDLNDAYNILSRTKSVSAIPPALLAKLGAHRPALFAYQKALVEGVAVKTDPAALYTLITMSSVAPDAFAKVNILGYMDRLSSQDLEQLGQLQASIRKGKTTETDKLFVSEKNQNTMVDEALTGLGLAATPAELAKPENKDLAERISRFRRAVREATARHEASTGKAATDADVQRIVDTLATPTGTRTSGILWNKETTPTYVFETSQAHVTDAALIPRTAKGQIDDALRRQGLPVDDAHRLDIFNDYIATTVRKDR